MNDYKPLYNICAVIVGDQQCGKTLAARRYFTGEIPSLDYRIPSGYKKFDKFIPVQGEKLHLVLRDTGGQSSLLSSWLSDYDRKKDPWTSAMDIVIICFDVSNSDSLENAIQKWYPEVRWCMTQ